jgi:hypothetical protein
MAKINIASRKPPAYFKVFITVLDPDCEWNVKSVSEFYKVFRASNYKLAEKAAKQYCIKQSHLFKNTQFKYSKEDMRPYYYHEHIFQKETD